MPPDRAVEALHRQWERGVALIQNDDWTNDDLHNWLGQTMRWIEGAFGETSSEASRFDAIGNRVMIDMGESSAKRRQRELENHKLRLNALLTLKQTLEDMVAIQGPPSADPIDPADAPDPQRLRSVFVVHGHDNEMRLEVCRYLEKLGMRPIVLFEQVNRGRTIIEKLEEEGDGAGYALVLVSPDDIGGKAADKLQSRPRQNVVFELGLFIGKLGRKNVCVLKRGEFEILSDIHGLVYHSFESDWRVALVREMKAAGMQGNWAAAFD